MSQSSFRPRRSLGQNFLKDATVLDRILEAAQAGADDWVLEVGPGEGVLTDRLVDTGARVLAVELDERLRPGLAVREALHPGLRVVWGDIMDMSWESLGVPPGALLVANIPYYLTSPLILRAIGAEEDGDKPVPFRRLVLMVQAEVADRLLASPGTRAWGALSVAVQQRCVVRRVCRVPRTAFRPAPAVDSAVVCLDIRDTWAVPVSDTRHFRKVVRAVFAQRRKTLRNALRTAGWAQDKVHGICDQLGFEPLLRGETLDLGQLVALSDALGR